jgi:hypothetical protein
MKAGWKYGLEAATSSTAKTRILLKKNGRHEETRTPELCHPWQWLLGK